MRVMLRQTSRKLGGKSDHYRVRVRISRLLNIFGTVASGTYKKKKH